MTINYSNGKIYKIVDNKSDMIYIGSTCKTLEQRLKSHISNYKKYKSGKYNYVTVFKTLENNDYKIELIKNYSCNSKNDLEREEGQFIKDYRNNKLNVVNKLIAGQTHKESCTQYRKNNKNKINEKHNCLCGGKYTCANKSRHEKSKNHCEFINAPKIIIPGDNNNITINIYCNSKDDLNKLNIV
ncbi:MAG: GIY-YIG nuclease family protein [Candidatus Kapaibacteriota bacterium]